MKTSQEKTANTSHISIETESIEISSSDTIPSSSTTSIPAPERALGLLVLMTVPCAWGTFAPVVRYVYEMDTPVPGFVFSAGYYIVASLTLNSLLFLQQFTSSESTSENKPESILSPWRNLPITGGLELGLYLFLGNCFQVVGLETVSADRAAFLVQLTTVFVPLLQAFTISIDSSKDENNFFHVIPTQTWFACILAFSGVLVMDLDNKEVSTDVVVASTATDGINMNGLSEKIIHVVSNLPSIGLEWGDIFVLIAAVCYTCHVVRLSKYANETTPLALATCKATTESILSIGLVGILWSVPSSSDNTLSSSIPSFLTTFSHEIQNFFTTYPSLFNLPTPAFLACLWTGWVTCAYTIYAQSFGQKRIPNPTVANLIYTTQPLFSATFAYWLLHETLGTWGFVGGGFIGVALALVTVAEDESMMKDSSIDLDLS